MAPLPAIAVLTGPEVAHAVLRAHAVTAEAELQRLVTTAELCLWLGCSARTWQRMRRGLPALAAAQRTLRRRGRPDRERWSPAAVLVALQGGGPPYEVALQAGRSRWIAWRVAAALRDARLTPEPHGAGIAAGEVAADLVLQAHNRARAGCQRLLTTAELCAWLGAPLAEWGRLRQVLDRLHRKDP